MSTPEERDLPKRQRVSPGKPLAPPLRLFPPGNSVARRETPSVAAGREICPCTLRPWLRLTLNICNRGREPITQDERSGVVVSTTRITADTGTVECRTAV